MTGSLPEILYFVIGGHGGQVYIKQWLDKRYIHQIVLNVVDWGGSTGVIGRALERVGQKALPVGDLRNNLGNLMEYMFRGEIIDSEKGLSKGQILHDAIQKAVSPTGDTTEDKQQIISEVLGLIETISVNIPNADLSTITPDDIKTFVENIYIKGYEQLEENEKKDLAGKTISHKVGNIFLAALAYKYKAIDTEFGGYNQMLVALKQMNIIPENMNFHFVDNKRMDLCAIDEKNQIYIRGEDRIDETKTPIKLSHFKLTEPGSTQIYNAVHASIISLVATAKFIVVPVGSEGNSYPWLEHISQVLSVMQKPILRFVNFAKERNSEGIAAEMAHLDKLGLSPYYYFPKTKEDLGIKEGLFTKLEERYTEQGKTLQLFSVQEMQGSLKMAINGLLNTNDSQVKAINGLLNINGSLINVIKEFLGTSDSLERLKNGLLDSEEVKAIKGLIVDSKVGYILRRVRQVMTIKAFNGASLGEVADTEIQLIEKGFRHDPDQIADVCGEFYEMILPENTELQVR